MQGFDVAIIGGGASGTLLAEQLLRRNPEMTVAVIDRAGQFARGVAYSTADPTHLLNVRAGSMSADVENPSDFVQWLARADYPFGPADFVPRGIYGEYLAERFAATVRRFPHRLRVLRADVVDVVPGHSRAELRLADGRVVEARRVVVATGNGAPSPLRVPDAGLFKTPRYVPSPWIAGALDHVDPTAEVLLVGTGLTAVDVVLSLHRRGHVGRIAAVSRHGRFPQPHTQHAAPPAQRAFPDAGSVRALLRQLRTTPGDGGWRAAVDALRPHTPALWAGFPEAEKARFLRHLRNLWDTHRHRMAPEAARVISELRARGQLVAVRGRLLRFEAHGGRPRAVLSLRGTHFDVPADVVVNCTGPAAPGTGGDVLGRALLRRGLARIDRHQLGLETRRGALVDDTGAPGTWLFSLGNLRRAEAWETTAMPEIRAQAAELAHLLVSLPQTNRPLRDAEIIRE